MKIPWLDKDFESDYTGRRYELQSIWCIVNHEIYFVDLALQGLSVLIIMPPLLACMHPKRSNLKINFKPAESSCKHSQPTFQ